MSDWFSQPEPESETEPTEPAATDEQPAPPVPPVPPTPPPAPPTPPPPAPPTPPPPAPPTPPPPAPPTPPPPAPPTPPPPVDPVPPAPVDPVPPAPVDPVPAPPTSTSTMTTSWMDRPSVVPPPRWNDPSPAPPAAPIEEPTLTVAYDTPPAPTIEPLPAPEPEPEPEAAPDVDLPTASSHSGVLDEVVFDLAYLSSEERRHLSMRLTGAGITHRFDVATDLIVGLSDADAIEGYLGEVQNPDGFDVAELDAFEEANDIDDEAVYSAMSNLYVAADKLMQRPGDGPSQGTFYLASDDVEGLPAPFGFDPRVWAQVLALTDSIVAKLDAVASENDIGEDARSLRQLLVNYV